MQLITTISGIIERIVNHTKLFNGNTYSIQFTDSTKNTLTGNGSNIECIKEKTLKKKVQL